MAGSCERAQRSGKIEGEAAALFFCTVFVLRTQTQPGPAAPRTKVRVKEVSGYHGRASGGSVRSRRWMLRGYAAAVRLPGGSMGEAGAQRATGDGKLSWPVLLLTLTAIVSSSISALCLYQLLSLRAEVDAIKSEVRRSREGGPENPVRVAKSPF